MGCIGTMLFAYACGEEPVEDTTIEYVEEELEPYVPIEPLGAVISYEVSPMRPRVLPDIYAYEPLADKKVICIGELSDTSFRVIEEATGKNVYTGVLEKRGVDEVTGEQSYMGDFSGFTSEGTYHIQVAAIGESYPFEIRNGVYETLFATCISNLDKLWAEDMSVAGLDLEEQAAGVHDILIALEYYTELFSDDAGISQSGNGIPDALDLVGRYVEALRSADVQSLSNKDLACYVGTLAAAGHSYKNFDKNLSGEYLKAAEDGFHVLEKRSLVEDEQSYEFYAASELYRADMQANCRTITEAYLTNMDHAADMNRMTFYGVIAYVSCKYTVDTSLCSKVMSSLLFEVEKLCALAEGEPFYVSSTSLQTECDNMTRIAIINYVITNHEYVIVQEHHLHYLLGRNPQGACYVDGFGRRMSQTVIDASPSGLGSTVLSLCEILLENR